MHPKEMFKNGTFNWNEYRPLFFDAFHRSISAYASAGIDLIVEHIIEQRSWAHQLADLLTDHDVFTVAAHCPMDELERREKERGNRNIGESQFHMKTYELGIPDIEIDTTNPVQDCADEVINAWQLREIPSHFSTKWRLI